MNLFDIIIISVGLAMDCLAVSITCGIIIKHIAPWPFLKIAFFFGLFQGIMPLIGWYAGSSFNEYISNIDHWIAFLILLALGGKMLYEYFKKSDDVTPKKQLNPYKLSVILVLALATSIDALAVGITFAFLDSEPYMPASIIAATTFIISLAGLVTGSKYGHKLHIPGELLGGLVLIGIGIKILIEHLFF
jgi:manganese efflux pump family protein